jgi:hypothetical protein
VDFYVDCVDFYVDCVDFYVDYLFTLFPSIKKARHVSSFRLHKDFSRHS